MVATPSRTILTRVACGVDLADHAPPDELARVTARVVRYRLDHADELVTEDPGERIVAAAQLDVRIADPGADDAHDGFTVGGCRQGKILTKSKVSVLEPKASHRGILAA